MLWGNPMKTHVHLVYINTLSMYQFDSIAIVAPLFFLPLFVYFDGPHFEQKDIGVITSRPLKEQNCFFQKE